MRSIRFGRVTALVLAVLAVSSEPLLAEEQVPKYVDEQEERLKEVDAEVIDAQIARFRAIFAKDKDEEEIERLDKKFRKLQKKRRELLRSTGKVY